MNILIIGGNRFFGRHLVLELLKEGHKVTLLNRGTSDDGIGDRIERLKADRTKEDEIRSAVAERKWDLVYDQVCYTASEARVACHIFRDRAKRYVVTSSESVYDDGLEQKENRFDPTSYSFSQEAKPNEDYQAAKRQMETVFVQEAKFDVAIARPSLVVGVDDYTGRLKWHIDRIRSGLPIYFPNIDIQSDFIRSDQAGLAMKLIGLSKVIGPVNCTTPGSISLRELIEICEQIVDRKANLAITHEADNHSPYGGRADKTMETGLLNSLGFDVPSSRHWMPQLLKCQYSV